MVLVLLSLSLPRGECRSRGPDETRVRSMVSRYCPDRRPNVEAFLTVYGLGRQTLQLANAPSQKSFQALAASRVERVLELATFAPGGESLRFDSAHTLEYVRVWKSANNNIHCYLGAINSSNVGVDHLSRHGYGGGLIDRVLSSNNVFTLVRDPGAHFASGYNEFMFRFSRKDVPRECWKYESVSTLLEMDPSTMVPLEYVIQRLFSWHEMDPEERKCWGPVHHAFPQSGQLAFLAIKGFDTKKIKIADIQEEAELRRFLDSNFEFPDDLQLPEHTDHCSPHPTSKDPLGSYAVAKRLFTERENLYADAVCLLLIIDYACLPEYLTRERRCMQTYMAYFEQLLRVVDAHNGTDWMI